MKGRWESWRAERRLVRRLRRQLSELGITGPMGMEEVAERLGKHRGRPTMLVPYPLLAGEAFGLWLGTTGADYILYQETASPLHREHIIAHEIGHMLCGHESDEIDDQVMADLIPGGRPDLVRSLLRRTHYDRPKERDAETAASLLLTEAQTANQVLLPSRTPRAERMRATLVDRPWL
ncbi:ImmA/IrrE family metallo-endopeptidase [Saccharopolyspora sp. NPDC049357]|uniref:ImmA/IrrE family metallo-endopeptidase n=1 Tax=Saccharopolyspora sp. NPDC049357 TaxID=3154507 RepID=UPI0034267413